MNYKNGCKIIYDVLITNKNVEQHDNKINWSENVCSDSNLIWTNGLAYDPAKIVHVNVKTIIPIVFFFLISF
jgi:hypothetical protein